MKVAIDTCILLDLLLDQNAESIEKVRKHHDDNDELVICDMVYGELYPIFEENEMDLELFLSETGIKVEIGFDLACIPDEGRIEILNNLQHIGCNESYKSDLGQQALLNGEPVTVVSFHRFHFSCSLYFSINFFISFTKFSISEILFFTIKYNSVSVTS